MEKKSVKIIVYGRVQGVNFRNSTLTFAESLGLNGYVSNLRDGSVEIIAQGKEEAIEELIKWSQHGSLFAKVEGMSYRWIESDREYKDFSILRSGSFVEDQAKSFLHLGKRVKDRFLGFDKTKVKIPSHVVIIPNGNRTWSKLHNLKSWEGYWHVAKRLDRLIDTAKEFDIKHLTMWGFSTENWKRSKEEIDQIVKLLNEMLDKFYPKFVAEKVRFRHLGRRDRIPTELMDKIKKVEMATKDFVERSVNLAFDYGGRDEILRAIDNIIKEGKTSISEDEFSELLDTSGLPDPDLIIRTAGEKRLSGLMPWQSVYSEFYSTNVLFPDFGPEHLREAILDFNSRKRTFGGDVNLNKVDLAKTVPKLVA